MLKFTTLLGLLLLGLIGCSPGASGGGSPATEVPVQPTPESQSQTDAQEQALLLEGSWLASEGNTSISYDITARGTINSGTVAADGQTSFCLGTWSFEGDAAASPLTLRVEWEAAPPNCPGGVDVASFTIVDNSTLTISTTSSGAGTLISGTYSKR